MSGPLDIGGIKREMAFNFLKNFPFDPYSLRLVNEECERKKERKGKIITGKKYENASNVIHVDPGVIPELGGDDLTELEAWRAFGWTLRDKNERQRMLETISDLTRTVSKGESDANSSKVKMTRLQNERDSLRKRLTAMGDYFKIEGVNVHDLEKAMELKTELLALQSEKSAMEDQLASLSSQMCFLKDQVTALTTDLHELRKTSEKEKHDIVSSYEHQLSVLGDNHAKILQSIQSHLESEAELMIRNATASKQRLESLVGFTRQNSEPPIRRQTN